MASSLRGSQTICGAFSKAASPRYVCHSCRQNLLRPRGQQLRAASTSLSSGRARRSQGLGELQSCPRASYATKSFVDYIHPEKEQRVQGFLEGNPEDEVIYEEATTWVGIESVGQERHLGDRQPSADAFKPFMQQSSSQKVDRDYFLVHLYSAIVDVLVNRTLGKELTDLYTTSPDVRAREVAASLGLSVTQSGTLAGLQADSLTLEQAMKDETHKSGMTGLEIEELMAKLKLNFSDPTTFEILKYFSFISRHRVPDPILSNVWNNDKPLTAFVDLLTRHYVQTAPKTVASTLKSRQEKALLAAKSGDPMDANSENLVKQTGKLAPLGPNVMVLPRRETPVDKQKEVGRWKIIEKELTARGLPVLGRHAPRKPQKQVEA